MQKLWYKNWKLNQVLETFGLSKILRWFFSLFEVEKMGNQYTTLT